MDTKQEFEKVQKEALEKILKSPKRTAKVIPGKGYGDKMQTTIQPLRAVGFWVDK
jgi:hypothetical protein